MHWMSLIELLREATRISNFKDSLIDVIFYIFGILYNAVHSNILR